MSRPTTRSAVLSIQSIASRDDQRRFWIGTGLIALAAVSFGLIPPLSRLAYDAQATPLALVLLRYSAFVVLVGGWLRLRRRPLRLPRGAVSGSLWLAALQLATSFGYVASVAFIPVSLAAIIFYTAPILVGLLAAASGREAMTLAKAAALLAAFLGLALALGPTFATLDPFGVGLAALAAVSLSLVIVLGGLVIRRTDAMLLTTWMNVWMFLAVAAYALAAGDVAMPQNAAGIAGAAGATLCSVVGFAAWFAAMPMISPIRVALTFNIEPVVTVLVAALLLGERLAGLQVAGGGLVLAALIATTAGGRR